VSGEPRAFDDAHIAVLQPFADQAAIALANARLIEAVERQRTELARFLSPQVAELVSSSDGEQLLAGHRAYITCLFFDLRGFTAFAETAAPEELLDVLREYHAALGELIPAHGGTLEHFAGDGIMAFFNDPLPVAEHELQAVRLALAAQKRLAQLGEAWGKRGVELALGVGIEAGYATVGRIGFEGRYDYGVVGPVTNLASRLSTRATAGQILIGRHVYAAVDEAVETAGREARAEGLRSSRPGLRGARVALGADRGGEDCRGLRVGRVERNDRQLGEREVAGGSERGERAEEREVGIVQAQLVHQHDVVGRRWIGVFVLLGCSGVRDELAVEGLQLGVARRLDLATKPSKEVTPPLRQIGDPWCQALRVQRDPKRVRRRCTEVVGDATGDVGGAAVRGDDVPAAVDDHRGIGLVR
jgi:class 3 adenylate cyclase